MAGYPGAQGRKPKPATIRERGEDRNDTPLDKLPKAPEHLSSDEAKEWRRAGKMLVEAKLITRLDLGALAAYCTAYCLWLEAKVNYTKNLVFETPNGFMQASPFLTIANKAQKQMIDLMGALGMTPVSRGRMPKAAGPAARQPNPPVKPAGGPGLDKPVVDPRAVLQ